MHVLKKIAARRRLLQGAAPCKGDDQEQRDRALVVEMNDGGKSPDRLHPMSCGVVPVEPGPLRPRGEHRACPDGECPPLTAALLIGFDLPRGG